MGYLASGHYSFAQTASATNPTFKIQVLSSQNTPANTSVVHFNYYFYIDNFRVTTPNTLQQVVVEYKPEILETHDYYPFGYDMPGRNVNGDYRYGFNGKEKDDEVDGGGNAYDFGARMLDPRIGRWFSVDPMRHRYPGMAPYAGFGNCPISLYDRDGKILKDPYKNPIYIDNGGTEISGKKVDEKTGNVIVVTQKVRSYTYFSNAGEPIQAYLILSQTDTEYKPARDKEGNELLDENKLPIPGVKVTSKDVKLNIQDFYDCHGLTLIKRIKGTVNVVIQGGKFSGNDIAAVLTQDGYTPVLTKKANEETLTDEDISKLKRKDIVVFRNKDGESHSAIYLGNGRFVSKNGTGGPQVITTYADLKLKYADKSDPESSATFYSGGDDKTVASDVISTDSNTGETKMTATQIKNAVKK